jgi:MFS family permease
LIESPAFLEEKKKNEAKEPTLKVLKENVKYVSIYALLKGTGSGMYYFFSVFIVGFLADSTGTLTQKEVAFLVTSFVFGCGFSSALIGHVADKLSDKGRLIMNMSAFFSLHIVFLTCVYYQTFPWPLFVLIGAAARSNIIPIMPLLFNSLKVKNRFRVFAIGRSLGSILISGMTPLVCSAIYLKTENKYLTLSYPLLLMTLYSLTYFYALKTRKVISDEEEITEDGSPLYANTCETIS